MSRPGRTTRRPGAGADRTDRTGRAGWAGAPADGARYRRRRTAAASLVAVVLLGALVAGAWWAMARFGPSVEEVRVTGVRSIAEGDVTTAAAVPPGTPLAAVDTAGVEARVSGIPGVADVDVSRSWPHALEIGVVERAPVALVDAPDGAKLVDRTGLAYRTAPEPRPRLPLLRLPRVAPDDPATGAALAVLTALDQPVRDQVDAVVLGPGGTTLELALTDERTVLWGRWAGSEAGETPRRAAVLGPLLSREGSVYDVSSAGLPTVRD